MKLSRDEQNGNITLKFITLLPCGRSRRATCVQDPVCAPNLAGDPASLRVGPRGVSFEATSWVTWHRRSYVGHRPPRQRRGRLGYDQSTLTGLALSQVGVARLPLREA